MKVKFLHDFCGRETAMQEVKAGEERELIHQAAIELIAAGAVVEVREEPKPRRRVNVKDSQ